MFAAGASMYASMTRARDQLGSYGFWAYRGVHISGVFRQRVRHTAAQRGIPGEVQPGDLADSFVGVVV